VVISAVVAQAGVGKSAIADCRLLIDD